MSESKQVLTRGGLNLEEREIIKTMTVAEIAHEFLIDVELFLDAIDLALGWWKAGDKWATAVSAGVAPMYINLGKQLMSRGGKSERHKGPEHG